MASSFDLFHPISHHDSPYVVDPTYISNRETLRSAMTNRGFRMLQEEWWHYTLNNEPFPDTFFDFVVPCAAQACEDFSL
jgi:zinc D-Ala-D-Ala dipeptidase